MDATQTKGHEDKRTGMHEKKSENYCKTKKEKLEARHKSTQAIKSYARRLHSNKSYRLCYKAETGTLSHLLLSSSYSRRQRYQGSLLPLSSPPPREQINENQTELPGLGGCTRSNSRVLPVYVYFEVPIDRCRTIEER